ncbi:MAG: TonB-dependent receptor [Magnetococcales bacterium]|nr:TonB-dependent receptor [Magnetococcales bacterium]
MRRSLKNSKKNSLSYLLLGTTALFLVSPPAFSQEKYRGEIIDDTPVVITATRTPVPLSSTLSPVTVLTRQDVENKQTDSLPELLSGLPGVDITQNGSAGGSSNIYMRGTGSGHVLVLVNGRKMGSATLGTVSWEHIPVSQIERIEVVRGPRSSLYGSEAIGGIVQIFTHDRSEGWHVDAELGYGNWNTSQASLTLTGGSPKTNGSLSIAGFNSDGFNSTSGSSQAEDADDDGYRNASISGRVGHSFDNGATVDFDLFYASTRNEYDRIFASSADVSKGAQQSMGITVEHDPLDKLHMKFTAGVSGDDSSTYLDGVKQNQFDTQRINIGIQGDLDLNDKNLLTVGVDFLEDKIDTTTAYDETKRYDVALFTQIQGKLNKNSWVLGLRGIENEQFGSHVSGNAEWGYDINESLRMLVGYGTAFKAPTFNDLYYPTDAFGEGNANLSPEKSESFELGLEGEHKGIDWSTRLYRTNIDNLISWSDSAVQYFYTPTNVDKAQITGIELEAGKTIGQFDISTNVTVMDPKNKTSGLQLNRRAKTSAKLNLDYRFKSQPIAIHSSVFYQSSRYNDANNTLKLPGYGVVNLSGNYDLDENWQVRLKADNIFDKDYKTVASSSSVYYKGSGRAILLSLAWRYSK